MDAVEFIKEAKRMCNDPSYCIKCRLEEIDCCIGGCVGAGKEQKVVETVEQYSKEHPQKTYLDKFKEMFPNAKMNSVGTPKMWPCDLGWGSCEDDLRNFCGGTDCWHEPCED